MSDSADKTDVYVLSAFKIINFLIILVISDRRVDLAPVTYLSGSRNPSFYKQFLNQGIKYSAFYYYHSDEDRDTF